MFKRILLNVLLFYKGIRFYKTDRALRTKEFKKAVFKTHENHILEFYVYKENMDNLVLIRGRIKHITEVVYIIQLKITDDLPLFFSEYNNLKILFSSNSLFEIDQDYIANILLNVYIEFLLNEIKNRKD